MTHPPLTRKFLLPGDPRRWSIDGKRRLRSLSPVRPAGNLDRPLGRRADGALNTATSTTEDSARSRVADSPARIERRVH
jgi:hypothetical protein